MPPLALSEVVLEFFEAAAAPSGEGGEGGYRGQQHGVRDGARRVAALADQGAFSTLQVGGGPFLGRKDWCAIWLCDTHTGVLQKELSGP